MGEARAWGMLRKVPVKGNRWNFLEKKIIENLGLLKETGMRITLASGKENIIPPQPIRSRKE